MYVVTGSITSALRLSKVLESQYGQIASVVHTPLAIKKGGCSYSVKTDMTDKNDILNAAKSIDVNIKGIYGEKTQSGGRTFYDIS